MSLRCSRTAFAGGRCSMRTIAGAALLALAGAALGPVCDNFHSAAGVLGYTKYQIALGPAPDWPDVNVAVAENLVFFRIFVYMNLSRLNLRVLIIALTKILK